MRDPQSIDVNEDTRLIPIWSIVAAAAAFVLVEYYFWLVFPQTSSTMRRRWACASTSISPGACWRRSTS